MDISRSSLESKEQTDELDKTGKYAAHLALIEVGLGSILHGLKIPLRGHLLSLNQGAVLSYASSQINNASCPWIISSICACLKSLSPAGNKLGPMLSIAMQGFLLSSMLSLFGLNIVGYFLGGALLSCWAFVQPFITLYFFFGHSLLEAIQFYADKIQTKLGISMESQLEIFLVIILMKAIVGGVLCLLFAKKWKHSAIENPPSWLKGKVNLSRDQNVTLSQVVKLSLKDITRPFFLISLILMIIFFAFAKHEWSQIIWLSLRPIGMAFVFFFISRHPYTFRKMRGLTERYPHSYFVKTFQKTISYLR